VGGEVLPVSYARCVVANKSNVVIAELEPEIDYISWKLNKVGKTRFTLNRTDANAIKYYLKFGTRLIIEFDNGLPTWGGVLSTPRDWRDEQIHCMAYSIEHIFKFRTTWKNRTFEGDTVGAIFKQLLTDTNNRYESGVDIGNVWEGGTAHNPTYHNNRLLDIFQKDLTGSLSGADFDITATVEGGKLVFTANLYETKGSQTGVALVEGTNVTDMVLSEQGDIINSWRVAGGGLTWGQRRLMATAIDWDSVNQYGYLENSTVLFGVDMQTTLDNHAADLLAETKDPLYEYTLDAVDEEPAPFATYGLGDWVYLQSDSHGFDGVDTTVRVMEREFRPDSGACTLKVKE
jgi:hypothetical protein